VDDHNHEEDEVEPGERTPARTMKKQVSKSAQKNSTIGISVHREKKEKGPKQLT
jgi:hypothetical protein